MKLFLFWLACVQLGLYGDLPQTEQKRDPVSLTGLDGEPSAIVRHAVNAITGEFAEAELDLKILGPEPLTIERFYTSINDDKETAAPHLQAGWHLNHGGYVNHLPSIKPETPGRQVVIFKGGCGTTQLFESEQETREEWKMKCSKASLKYGMTNVGQGEISGQTNPKNRLLIYRQFQAEADLIDGSGTRHVFKEHFLKQVIKPNGRKIHYHYDKEKRLKKVISFNQNNQELAKFIFSYPSKESFKDDPKMIIYGSDNRHATYRFLKNDNRYYLKEVERPSQPKETFEYEAGWQTLRLVKKRKPDGRYIAIKYHTNPKKSDSYDKVRAIFEPVGADQTPIASYRFEYTLFQDSKIGGTTIVFDPSSNKIQYDFDASKRLVRIAYFDKDEMSHEERYYWGSQQDAGNLISKVLAAKNGKPLLCRYLQYDERGNATIEQIWDNLKLKNSFTVDAAGIPHSEKGECYQKEYVYSSDGVNLLLEERDFRKKIRYRYYPNTLLKAKYICDRDRIVMRHFFEYDENGTLILEITDDGSQEKQKDMTHVTERHIKRIKPRTKKAPFGLPEVIEESYWDFKAGNERLISKIVNEYTIQGYLCNKKHYGSEGDFLYEEHWEYDSMGHVILERNGLNHKIERQYDDNGNLKMEIGPIKGTYKKFAYDYADRMIKEEVYDSHFGKVAISHKYNLKGERIATVDYHGNETGFHYDHMGRVIKQEIFPKENQEVIAKTIYRTKYDPLGNPTEQIDPIGNKTKASFNRFGKPYKIKHPDGSMETFEYDPDGLLYLSVSKNGLKTLYEYDCLSRVISKKSYSSKGDLLESTDFKYNAFHLLSVIEQTGRSIDYSYDAAGRQIRVTKDSSRTDYVYDTAGRVKKVIRYCSENINDPISEIYEYDALGHITEERIEDSNGKIQKRIGYHYDPLGNRTEMKTYILQGTALVKTDYDCLSRPVKVIDEEGLLTRIFYDDSRFFQETIDPAGIKTETTFNAFGKAALIEVKNIFNQTVQKRKIVYDQAGNQIKTIEFVKAANGRPKTIHTDWEFDACNRIVKQSEAAGTVEQKVTLNSYNAMGNLKEVVKPDGVMLSFAYDDLNRLKRLQSSDFSIDYLYHYDAAGRVKRIENRVSGKATDHSYDRLDRLIEEVLETGSRFQYSYDNLDRMTALIYPDGSKTAFNYAGNHLNEICRYKDGEIIYRHIYREFDLSGNVLDEEMIGSAGTIQRAYDEKLRLIKIENRQWKEEIPKDGFDFSGNMSKRRIEDIAGAQEFQYSYDDLNQLVEEAGLFSHFYAADSVYNLAAVEEKGSSFNALNQLLQSGSFHYRYDLCGRLKQIKNGDEEIHLTYDALDRLIAVRKGTEWIEYQYDGLNRRLCRLDPCKTLYFFYQGLNEIGSGLTPETFQELRILGIGKGAEIGASVAFEIKGKVYAPVHDSSGHLRTLLDPLSGKVVESYRYSAFRLEEIIDGTGKSISEPLTAWNFSSKRSDPMTGFINFGRRDYDPTSKRFITPDPKGFSAGVNLYAYVGNNPLTHHDPYGLMAEKSNNKGSFSGFLKKNIERLAKLPGRAIEWIGRHCIPIPGIKDVVEVAGRALRGGCLRCYVPSYSQKHSFGGYYPGVNGEINERARYFMSNGVGVSWEEFYARLQKASKDLNGSHIWFAYNATHGLALDGLEWLSQRLGFRTHSASIMKETLLALGDQLKSYHDGEIWSELHSQSNEMLNSIKASLPAEVKEKIVVRSFGSPILHSNGGYKNVVNYVSAHDGVPHAFDPLGAIKGHCSSKSNVVILRPHGLPAIDHAYEGRTYQAIVARTRSNYRRVY